MTNKEKQLVLSSYLGDCYWIRQKHTLRIKFGGYVKDYLEWKRSLITTFQKSKLWASKNRNSILYEFSVGKSNELNKLKMKIFPELVESLGDLKNLGFAILMYDNGYLTSRYNYGLSIGKYYSKKFANYLNNYINSQFNLHGVIWKQTSCKGYSVRFPVYETVKIAKILSKYPIQGYKYKIPPSETISLYESRYKDIPKDLEGKRAYDIVRSLEKSKEN